MHFYFDYILVEKTQLLNLSHDNKKSGLESVLFQSIIYINPRDHTMAKLLRGFPTQSTLNFHQNKTSPPPRNDFHFQTPQFLQQAAIRSASVLLAGLLLNSSPALAATAETFPSPPSTSNPLLLRGTAPSPPSNPLRSLLRGTADFYRSRQQANGGQLLLGPIQLSRQRLVAAAAAAENKTFVPAIESLRGASLDCIVWDFEGSKNQDLSTASSRTQEFKLGDPCKFRLVVKNATTLTRDAELVEATELKLQLILRQLQLLDDTLDVASQNDVEAVAAIPSLFEAALQSNAELEASVKQCLGL